MAICAAAARLSAATVRVAGERVVGERFASERVIGERVTGERVATEKVIAAIAKVFCAENVCRWRGTKTLTNHFPPFRQS
jgi:hypothetical protein